jgi:hypothetical protein
MFHYPKLSTKLSTGFGQNMSKIKLKLQIELTSEINGGPEINSPDINLKELQYL